MEATELHQRAYAIVQPLFAQTRASALERLRALIGSGDSRGAIDLHAIIRAARLGRVETLFVVEKEHVWGKYSAEDDRVDLDPAPSADNQDLLDQAAVCTLLNSGSVHVLSDAEMPSASAMAAIFRY